MNDHRDIPQPNRLIERWFPVAAVDEACGTTAGSGQSEKAIFTWFASRPIAQARAAVLCSLRVADAFPKNPDGSYPWGYLWVTTMPCDSCGHRFPLIDSLTLRHPYPSSGDPGQALELRTESGPHNWSLVPVDGRGTSTPTLVAA